MSIKNSVRFIGHLTRDPEYPDTQSGKTMVKFSIAVNRIGKDADPDYINCKMFDKSADRMREWGVGKGREIAVEGELHNEKYTDRASGAVRDFWCVTVRDWEPIGKRPDEAAAPAATAAPRRAVPNLLPDVPESDPFADD